MLLATGSISTTAGGGWPWGCGPEEPLHHFCYNVTETVQQTRAPGPAPGTPRPRDAPAPCPAPWDVRGPQPTPREQPAPSNSRGAATGASSKSGFARTPSLGSDASRPLCSATPRRLLGVPGPRFPACADGNGPA